MEIEKPSGKSIPSVYRGFLTFLWGLDLLYTLSYEGMGVFPEFDLNIHAQFWIAARYMESISFLLAPLLLTGHSMEHLKKSDRYTGRASFAWEVFLAYAGITVLCLFSILVSRNFPVAYIEGSDSPFLKWRVNV